MYLVYQKATFLLPQIYTIGIHFSTSAAKKSTTNDKKNTKPDGICKNSSLEESETESSWDGSNLSYSDATVLPSQVMFPQTMEGEEEPKAPLMKPPHSFSTLIFLSIESSSSKALPVRDIYAWITKHFPYYCFAPVGWKNSVRHNLSLNKSFCKVERGPVSLHAMQLTLLNIGLNIFLYSSECRQRLIVDGRPTSPSSATSKCSN